MGAFIYFFAKVAIAIEILAFLSGPAAGVGFGVLIHFGDIAAAFTCYWPFILGTDFCSHSLKEKSARTVCT